MAQPRLTRWRVPLIEKRDVSSRRITDANGTENSIELSENGLLSYVDPLPRKSTLKVQPLRARLTVKLDLMAPAANPPPFLRGVEKIQSFMVKSSVDRERWKLEKEFGRGGWKDWGANILLRFMVCLWIKKFPNTIVLGTEIRNIRAHGALKFL